MIGAGLEMLRKVSITGLLIFFSKGSMLQIVVAVMITFGFLIATSQNMPFKDGENTTQHS